jgi:hypothetical protein
MISSELCKLGSLVYPILLTQQAGEISESKAAELLNMNIEDLRDVKHRAIQAVLQMVDSLPSPSILLLEGTKVLPKSPMSPNGL